MRRVAMIIGLIVVGLVLAVVTGWGSLVLYYMAPGPSSVRSALAWCFVALGLATLVTLILGRARTVLPSAFVIALVLVAVVWRLATPANSREWQPEVAALPCAVADGDRVTVHNLR